MMPQKPSTRRATWTTLLDKWKVAVQDAVSLLDDIKRQSRRGRSGARVNAMNDTDCLETVRVRH